MPYFLGPYKQRGGGFGALASAIGRTALPLAGKIISTAAKKLPSQSIAELLDIFSKKTPMQALKKTISNTVKKQTGGWLALQVRQIRINRKRSKRSGSKPRKGSKMNDGHFKIQTAKDKSVGFLYQS